MWKYTNHHSSESALSLLQKKYTFTKARIDMIKLNSAVKKLKKAEAPIPLLTFFDILTQPLASAKSAIDQMKKNKITIPESR